MVEISPKSLSTKLPVATENAADVAKLVTGVAMAFAGIFFPPAAIGAAVLPIAIDRYVNRPRDLLLKELKKGNLSDLSAEQVAPFVPMAYKFLEAAKEGEYEHNLEILAAYLSGEMKQNVPDPASFSRMVRRVEGLSNRDLKVLAMIETSADTYVKVAMDEPLMRERQMVTTTSLQNSPNNARNLTRSEIQESLVDLAARGFLIANAATRYGKAEEFYRSSSSFHELMDRARDRIIDKLGEEETKTGPQPG